MSEYNTTFSKLNSRRRPWNAAWPTAPEQVTPGSEDTISRCLSLTDLEISVKEFITEGLSKEQTKTIGEEGLKCLLRNIEDEDKHLIALTNCRKVYKDYKHYDENVNILKAWEDCKDNEITKAATLEQAVFFVILPIYRQFGTVTLRNTAMWVSSDESIHSAAHRLASRLIGHKPSKSLDNLRKATVAWLLEKFEVPGYTKEQFMKASDSLMYKGTSDLNFSMSYTTPAFFESPSNSHAYYA